MTTHYFVKMDKNDMKNTIVEQMKLFDQDPVVFESERHEITVGEYIGHIRKIYLKRGEEPTKYDVEYKISLSYKNPSGLKKNSHSWGAYIYINRPDYLNYKTFKSIKDTDYGVEWVKW
jgi:hypothetical protein